MIKDKLDVAENQTPDNKNNSLEDKISHLMQNRSLEKTIYPCACYVPYGDCAMWRNENSDQDKLNIYVDIREKIEEFDLTAELICS